MRALRITSSQMFATFATLATLAMLALAPDAARADELLGRDMCRAGKFKGRKIDLAVKDADLEEVFRLLADRGDVNLVIADGVAGKVTTTLKRVPWDQAACSIAASHDLRVTMQDTIMMVGPKKR